MIKYLQSFLSFKSEFSRNVLTLLSGAIIAQIIPFILSPVLSRIFSPEDFGEYAVFNSIISVLVILSTARFEYAIALPEENEDGLRIVKLILILTFSVSAISFLIFFLFQKPLSDLFNIKNGTITLPLIPVTLIFIGIFQSLTFWFNRMKDYKIQAISKLTTSAGQSSFAVFFGFLKFGSPGLILSYALGQFAGCTILSSRLSKDNFRVIKVTESGELRALAGRYRKFPTFMTLGSLLNSLSGQLPIFMIASYFGTEIVGAMSFAQTMVVVPTGLISNVFADVVRQKAIEDFRTQGTCRPLLLNTLKSLFIIGLVPFTVFFFIAPSLFAWLFGSEWRMAGEFARIMTTMFFMRFVFMSVSGTVIVISERLEYDIIWQAGLLLFTFISISVGHYLFGDIKKVLILTTLVSSVFYIISFLMAYKFSQKVTKDGA